MLDKVGGAVRTSWPSRQLRRGLLHHVRRDRERLPRGGADAEEPGVPAEVAPDRGVTLQR